MARFYHYLSYVFLIQAVHYLHRLSAASTASSGLTSMWCSRCSHTTLYDWTRIPRTTKRRYRHKQAFKINIYAMAADLIWILLMYSLWSKQATHDEFIWQSLKNAHNFVLLMSVINAGIRV